MKRVSILLGATLACAAVVQFGQAVGLAYLVQVLAAFAGVLALMAAAVIVAASYIDHGQAAARRAGPPDPGPRVPEPMPVPPIVGLSLPRMSDAPEAAPAIPDGLDTATGELVGDRVNRLEEVQLDLGRKLEEQFELTSAALVKLGRQVQRLVGPGPFVGEAQADEEGAR